MDVTSQTSVPSSSEGSFKQSSGKGRAMLERQLQGLLGGLSTQFLLGLALATVADYDPDTHTGNHAAHQTLLVLHIVVAVGILIGSIVLVAAVKKQAPRLLGMTSVGLAAILVSIGTGMARLSVDNEWLTFLMGAGFVVAIGVYGRLLGEVMKSQGPST